MKRWIAPLVFGVVSAGSAHYAVLHFAPSLIMSRAMDLIAQRGAQLHQFQIGQRTTPETQTVVRPSPDLAYSACLSDLSQAPDGLVVTLAATPGYSSLSFFDSDTNNFQKVRGNGQTQQVRLLPPGMASTDDAMTSPTEEGVILARRLAPSQEEFDAAAAIAAKDSCAPA